MNGSLSKTRLVKKKNITDFEVDKKKKFAEDLDSFLRLERSSFDFCAGFAALGLAQGGLMTAVQFILSSGVAKERMGTANGVNDAAGALARVLAPLCPRRD